MVCAGYKKTSCAHKLEDDTTGQPRAEDRMGSDGKVLQTEVLPHRSATQCCRTFQFCKGGENFVFFCEVSALHMRARARIYLNLLWLMETELTFV